MKAWQFTGAHKPLELIERPDPVPGPGQVVLDVRGAGLCLSDVGFLDGTLTAMLATVPIVLGHEVAGTIASIGPDVTDFALGDRVISSGPESFAPGWTVDGGYATKCLVMASGLIRLPGRVSFVQGAAATDAGQTAYGGVMGAGEMQAGQRVGIIGLGGLGMTGARIAVINGAAEVYAAEPRREAWKTAKELGVRDVVSDVSDLAELQLDLIVDFAGFGTTTAGAIAAVRPGGTVSQVGLGKIEATISTALLTGKSVKLHGSRGGRAGDTEKVIAHMGRGELFIEASAIRFEEIPDGLERLARGSVVGRLVAEPN
jgi:propanol-preferring alcohol dehydrogenase